MSARAVAGAVNDLSDQRPPLSSIIFNMGIVRRSAIIALIVGTILNLIAQGDFLLDGQPLNFWKICLTYCVPYCVATYGAVTARLETYRKQAAAAGKDLA
ncbi:MAG: nitrate/nitrite transporter NrtS [Alphaproteobacteria bacterium]|nr:nitrate/nitrite transporter NrtS [Alphaproteobacteria bacterium]